MGVVLPTAVVVAAVTGFLLSRVLRVHRERPMTGREGLVGEEGRAINELAPDGNVHRLRDKESGLDYLADEGSAFVVISVSLCSQLTGGTIAAGNKVRVVAVHDRRIDVIAVGDDEEGRL